MTYEGDKKIITCLMQEVIGLMWCPAVDFPLILSPALVRQAAW